MALRRHRASMASYSRGQSYIEAPALTSSAPQPLNTMLLGPFLSLQTKHDPPPAADPSPRRCGGPTLSSPDTWRLLHLDYEVCGFINNGRDGTVLKRARHIATGRQVALKVIPVSDQKGRERAMREGELLWRLAHKNVVRLYDVYESSEEVILVLEYCDGGDYLDRVNSRGKFTEDEARRLFKQLVSALAFLHSRGIVHRDVKLDNLGVCNQGPMQLKILDFGFAETYREDELLTTSCGTLEYAAPELLRPKGQVHYRAGPVDVWSAGVCLFAFVTGCLPFEAECDESFIEIVKDPDSLQLPPTLSEPLRELLAKMLNVDPSQRPSFADIRGCKWLNPSGPKKLLVAKHDSFRALSPEIARKRPKQAKQPSFWRSILHTLKIAEP